MDATLSTDFPAPSGLLSDMDACFVIGGDGTLLNLMEEAVAYDVPVAGIRHGQLGFLATFSPEEMKAQLPPLFRGEYKVSRRGMLAFKDSAGMSRMALNDLVVKSGSNGRLARFSVSVEKNQWLIMHVMGLFFLHRQDQPPIIWLLEDPLLIRTHRWY